MTPAATGSLAFLAAIIPIVASLYATGSLLLEHARAAHDARAYARISQRFGDEMDKLNGLDSQTYIRGAEDARDRRNKLMEANGLDPRIGTAAHFNASQSPTAPNRLELRRQWALLIGSVVGIVLLAVDAGLPA